MLNINSLPNTPFFRFDCTVCQKQVIGGAPTVIYAIHPDGHESDGKPRYASDQHNACSACVKRVEEHNRPYEEEIDKQSIAAVAAAPKPDWSIRGNAPPSAKIEPRAQVVSLLPKQQEVATNVFDQLSAMMAKQTELLLKISDKLDAKAPTKTKRRNATTKTPKRANGAVSQA
jgi:hypothetical protein